MIAWLERLGAAKDPVVLQIRRQLVRDKHGVRLADLKIVGSRRTRQLSRPLDDSRERHRVRVEAEELVGVIRWHNDRELIFTTNVSTPNPDEFGKTAPGIYVEAVLNRWSIPELRHLTCPGAQVALPESAG